MIFGVVYFTIELSRPRVADFSSIIIVVVTKISPDIGMPKQLVNSSLISPFMTTFGHRIFSGATPILCVHSCFQVIITVAEFITLLNQIVLIRHYACHLEWHLSSQLHLVNRLSA